MSDGKVKVSGPIKYDPNGMHAESYFIESSSMFLGLDTRSLEPKDLRALADHLEEVRGER